MSNSTPDTKLTAERLRNTRAWAAARVGQMSGADVIVGAIDELLQMREDWETICEAAQVMDSVGGRTKALLDLPGWAQKAVLAVREQMVRGAHDEAWHQLYIGFTPKFCNDPWAALEGRKCACTNHD